MASLLYVAALLISAHVGVANASEVTPAPAPPVCKVVLQDNLMHAELLGHKHVDDDEIANAISLIWLVILVSFFLGLCRWGHRRWIVVDSNLVHDATPWGAKPYTKVRELRMV